MSEPHNNDENSHDIRADLELFDAAPPPPSPGRMWRLLLTVVLIASVVGLGAILSRYVTALQSAPASVNAPRVIPYADVHPLGANFFLSQEVEEWKRHKTLEMAKSAGIHWVKQQFPWEALEPAHKGEFIDPKSGQSSWVPFDQFVDMANAMGLEIIARLDRPPAWTRQNNKYAQQPPDNFDDYGDFVAAFVQHYRGRIHYIQVWNEPNIFPEWGDQPVDPSDYVRLLRIAYQRAKAVDPDIVILSAPLAITLESPPDRQNMSDLDYLEGMYRAGAKPYFDILSANAFGMDLPPDDPPDRNILNFRRVELQRAIMVQNGDSNKAIWLNEYAWNAAPETMPRERLHWQRVTDAQQAAYTVQGIRYAREHWPWVGAMNIWYFRQVGAISPELAEYYFRLVDVDFTPRPVYLALQQAAPEWGTAGPGTYQETSAAITRSGNWQLRHAPEASAGLELASITPGDMLTVTFRGPAVDLIAAQNPNSGILWVALDGRPVSGLPRDAAGRSYVNLYAPQPAWQQRIPLIRNAGPDVHHVTLTVSNERDSRSVGLRAEVDGIVVPTGLAPLPWRTTGTLLALALLASWLLWRDIHDDSAMKIDGSRQ
ncbi:MAG: hypothetical protein GXP41_04040 [Chloroflexi bacterium]|nr:hypothetical protein [Chloroflexota bacterium]